MTKLTAKQQAFVDAYLGEARGCATEAASLAGYKGNRVTLAAVGGENLRKPQIAERIAELLDSSPLSLSRERILGLLGECAEGGWGDLQVAEDGSQSVTVTKASDRLKALELLGKHRRLFADRVEHTGKDGKPIEHQHNQGPDLSKLSTEQLRAYKAHMAAAARVLKAKEDDNEEAS